MNKRTIDEYRVSHYKLKSRDLIWIYLRFGLEYRDDMLTVIRLSYLEITISKIMIIG